MGDMKTPDFDDLLAAFDIPDIDAKEAIQSRSDQDQVQDQVQVGGDAGDVRETGSPSSHGERPAVSVIVKNMVRSESMEDGEGMESTHSPEVAADPPGHLTSPLSPDLTEPQISNGFEGSVAVDHHHHHQGSEPWSLRSPLGGDDDGGGDKVGEVGLIQHTTDVMNSLKPLLFPSSPHLSPPPLPPLPPPQEDNRHLLVTSPPPLLTQNGSVKTQMNSDDDDDSEPDLGSPLVIQESPVSPVPPPPLPPPPPPPRLTPQSPEPTSCDVSRPPRLSLPPPLPAAKPEPPSDDGDQLPPLPGPPRLDEAPPTLSTSEEEKYPEHVIDERDSPESPPPSETGQLVPELTTTSDPNHDEMMDAEPSSEGRQGDGEEMADDVKENGGGGSSVSETDSSALRPLKVKIKMSTGSITRTVAPKRNVKASSRLADGSRPSPESHNTKTTKMAATPAEVKQKTTTDVKPKVSATAVSITKTAALPSVCTSSSRGGGINLRSLGQKTLHSGVMLPAAAPQTNRPASIVNSSGAIISKTQTNLVETFNKILNNKNLLPSYKPDLSAALTKEWGIPLPAQGYRCLECGDAFALEQSLARHYDRRSLRIEVTCNHCAKRLAFFNKCSLLLHAREHKERGLIMQCSHLVMKPVPVEQMIGQHEPTTMTTTSGPSSSSSSSRKSDEVHHLSNKCPECSTQFSSREEVADHFQEVRASQSTPCTECTPPMMLPNSCSAAAHQRLHQGCSAPHVCPECGGSAKQPPLLQTHLDETCLHFARRIGYRCSSCQVVFGGLNSVKSHIQQAHCDMFHKCPSCPMAFKSAPSIQSHIAAQHPATPEGQAMLIYKCVMCDTVFTNKAQLHVHFDSHLTNQKVHVFKCPECTKLFSQKNSLLDHFKTHKTPAVIKRELPSSPAVSSRSRPAVKVETSSGGDGWSREKEEKVKTPSGWKCAPCHARYTEREDYIKHMSEQHGKVLKKFPCNKCESSFTTTSSLRRHIRDKHKVVTRGFRCHLCTESKKTFSSRSMLERHVQLRHSVDSVSQDTMMGGADEADSSSEQDGAVASRRRRRGVVKTEQEDESTDGTSPVKKARSSSSVSDSGFRCAPCGFTSSEQTSFLDHIAQHRRGGGADGGLQCLHCGACFTSNSSLSRHRFITHKVRDALGDTHQTAAAALPAPSPGNGDLDSSSPSSPSSQTAVATRGKDDEDALTCRVCGKQFEKATDLNTHFRTHGMAFINARNTTKTTP